MTEEATTTAPQSAASRPGAPHAAPHAAPRVKDKLASLIEEIGQEIRSVMQVKDTSAGRIMDMIGGTVLPICRDVAHEVFQFRQWTVGALHQLQGSMVEELGVVNERLDHIDDFLANMGESGSGGDGLSDEDAEHLFKIILATEALAQAVKEATPADQVEARTRIEEILADCTKGREILGVEEDDASEGVAQAGS